MAELIIRKADDADFPQIIELCRESLGWPDDPRNAELLRWKHLENPFGRSAMWVALEGGRFVGFRAMMRWRFRRPDGAVLHAVRAVDTATLPSCRGRGVFGRLTRHAIEQLTADGVDFVFNTPNEMSRPGYLKMGWVDAGRVPIVVRPAGLKGLVSMPFALQAGSKWSEPLEVGSPTVDVERWQAGSAWGRRGITTDVTGDFLRWRFSAGPVLYRTVQRGDCGVTVRARRRGEARELAVSFSWGPERVVRELVQEVLDQAGCSYAVAARGTPGCGAMLPGVNLGPRLTLRTLARSPPGPAEFAFMLGDIELF